MPDTIHKVIVAIPSFNEEATVAKVVRDCAAVLAAREAEFEIVVIDDGSADRTIDAARAAGASVVQHGYNQGLGAAFRSAVAYALDQGAHCLVTIDADGQFSPADIPRLIAPIQRDEADLVTGSRFLSKDHFPQGISWVKHWGNRQMSRIISALVGRKFHDVSCGFRAYSRLALLHLNLQGRFTYTQETFLDLSFKGLRIVEEAVDVVYFEERKSRIASNIPKYALRTIMIILRCYRDYRPLRFFWSISLVAFLVASGLSVIFFGHYYLTGLFEGQLWAGFMGGFFFMVSLAFFIVGLAFDMFDRIRVNQERTLFKLQGLQHTEQR